MEMPIKINEKTVFSLQVVIIIITFSVWIIRLGDKVDIMEKQIVDLKAEVNKLKKAKESSFLRLYRLEEKTGLTHPYEREGDTL